MTTDGTGLPIGDVAQILDVPVSTVRMWTDQGKLACERNRRGHRRFQPSEIQRFAKAMARNQQPRSTHGG